jgi:H+-transporting ATPase
LQLQDKLQSYYQEEFIPFDPIRKRTEALIENAKEIFSVIKGAPQVILDLCKTEPQKNKISSDVNELAKKGYRSLGVAIRKEDADDYSFIGLIPLFDPPREDSVSTIASAKEMGIRIKMITGDNQAIAKEIGSILKIGSNILNTHELKHDEQALGIIENADGFSQVLPEDKYFIIDDLQNADHIVAMTGDGVNDAPALKKADAGIAVSGATDAARAAADLVLLSPGLSVIINALTEARHVFARMKNYATFRIAETIRIILFMTFSILVFNFYPVTAAMIIILALLNDIPIMMIAYDNVRASKIPVRWDMKETLTLSSALGIAGVIASFLAFYFLKKWGFPEPVIQTMIFLKLAVAGHSTIYVTRSGEKHFWNRPFPSPRLLIPTFSTQIVATLFAVYGLSMHAIGWKYAGWMWLYATAWFIFNDYRKMITYKLMRKRNK